TDTTLRFRKVVAPLESNEISKCHVSPFAHARPPSVAATRLNAIAQGNALVSLPKNIPSPERAK
ncbi:MAG: hypothetical protein NTV46_01220, partial [Verrucomicrobia bacterium]|nr:hypothetical protein [Verrucomicrobiota bacterium]